jgi:Tn3 transposase DDE domain
MFVHRHGEIRDRTFENQRYRASGLNLAIAAIILWNTIYLDHAVAELRAQAETPLDKPARPHCPARLGAHHLQWRLRLAIRTAQGGVSAAAKSALRLPRCRLAYGLEQILR